MELQIRRLGGRVPPSSPGRCTRKWLAVAGAGALGSQFVDDPDGYFGEPVAASYDDPSDRMFQPEAVDPAVSLLAELAGSGRALELAIGTGRIGLPLSQRGVPVHGIELSRAMVARLRGKPGGEAIGVTIGDMATARVDGTFTVAYLVHNTINNLTSQEAQAACFRNVAGHPRLEPRAFHYRQPLARLGLAEARAASRVILRVLAESQRPVAPRDARLQFGLQFKTVWRRQVRADRPDTLVQLEPIRTATTRAANAVGLYGPPGFKSPILRSSSLSSSYAQGLRPGRLLLSAFQGPCVAPAWPWPSSGPISNSLLTCACAGLSHA